MSRIATTLVGGVPHIVTKVVNGVRRVSCSCCCFCRNLNLDLLLYGEGIGGFLFQDYLRLLKEDCGDIPAYEFLKPDGRWRPRAACLRWLCRQTVEGEDGPITVSTFYGGPTTNDRDLNDLVLECLGERDGSPGLANGDEEMLLPNEEYGQCYLYGFEFYGWWLRRRRGNENFAGSEPDWISSDLKYDIYRRDEAIPLQ